MFKKAQENMHQEKKGRLIFVEILKNRQYTKL